MRFLLVLLFLIAWADTTFAAPATQPDSSWTLDPDVTFTAKDKSFSIRQYADKDQSNWKIWVFPKNRPAYILKDSDTGFESGDQSPSVWYPSPDGHWLARSQRLGSGESTLYLYHCGTNPPIEPVSEKAIGNLAEDFYRKYSGLTREQCYIDHPTSAFVKWQGSRTLIISLSGESTLCQPMWVTEKWLVAYDPIDRKFFLTDKLIDQNLGRIYPVISPVSETIPKDR